jgi:hypothetical protein
MIDTNKDRIVVSKKNGYEMHDVLEKISGGILYKFGTTLEKVFEDNPIKLFEEIIKFSRDRSRSFYIYADKNNLLKIQIMWFKLILKNPNLKSCYNIYKSNEFRYNLFQKAYYTTSKTNFSTPIEKFEKEFNSINGFKEIKKKSFTNKYSNKLGIEYQLATYFHSGKLKKELKETMAILLRKSFDDVLNEYKALFLSYYTSNIAAERVGLEKRYSFDDIDIFTDNSKIAEFFLSGRLWKSNELQKASGSGNFRFDKMTKEDHDTFAKFTVALGPDHARSDVLDNYYYTNNSIFPRCREGYKWQFMSCILKGKFTDELLDRLLLVETNIDSAQNLFSNVHLETVNGFMVQHILRLNKNADQNELRKYVLAV